MSTLTSLVKSGKRKIIKTNIGQPPEAPSSRTPIQSVLGRHDQGVSPDVTRPQQDTETTVHP